MKRNILLAFSFLGLWATAKAEPINQEVNCGATVKLTATPANPNYTFKQWSDGNKDNPRYVEVTEAKEFIAQFEASTPTDIGEAQQAPEVKKVIINDKLYIILGDQMYDTTGKRVR